MSQLNCSYGHHCVSTIVCACAGESIGAGGLCNGREHGMNIPGILDTNLLTLSRYSVLYTARYVYPVSTGYLSTSDTLILAESRYGLGLPLKLRPKANLPTYTKVSIQHPRGSYTDMNSLIMQAVHSISLVLPDSKPLSVSAICACCPAHPRPSTAL